MHIAEEIPIRMERLARVIARLDATVNWPLLGQLYCSEGGEDFFCEEQRDALVESGMEFAQELGGRLGTSGSGGSVAPGAGGVDCASPG